MLLRTRCRARAGRRPTSSPRSLVVASALAIIAGLVPVGPSEGATAFDVAVEVMMEDTLAQLFMAADRLDMGLTNLPIATQVQIDGSRYTIRGLPFLDDIATFTPTPGSTTPGVGSWMIFGLGSPNNLGTQTVTYSGSDYLIDSTYTYTGMMFNGLQVQLTVDPTNWLAEGTYDFTLNGVSGLVLLCENDFNAGSGQWFAHAGPLEGPIAIASGNVNDGTAIGTVTTLPEPSSWGMMLLGMVGTARWLHRSRKSRPTSGARDGRASRLTPD